MVCLFDVQCMTIGCAMDSIVRCTGTRLEHLRCLKLSGQLDIGPCVVVGGRIRHSMNLHAINTVNLGCGWYYIQCLVWLLV